MPLNAGLWLDFVPRAINFECLQGKWLSLAKPPIYNLKGLINRHPKLLGLSIIITCSFPRFIHSAIRFDFREISLGNLGNSDDQEMWHKIVSTTRILHEKKDGNDEVLIPNYLTVLHVTVITFPFPLRLGSGKIIYHVDVKQESFSILSIYFR